MPGNSNLTVSIGADVADLQAKFAIAQNAQTKFSAELRKMADEMRKAGEAGKAALMPAFQALSAQTAAARVETGRYGSELDKLLENLRENSAAHEHQRGVIQQNRVAFAELEHSARSVADGLAAGIDPMRLFGMEFSRVAQAVTEFNTISSATVAMVGGIGAAALAAAGGIAYMAREYERMRTARDSSAMGAAGGFNLSAKDQMANDESVLHSGWTHKSTEGLNYDQADALQNSLKSVRSMTPELLNPLMQGLPDIADMLGVKIPEAGKMLESSLSDLGGAGAATMDRLTEHMKDGETQMRAFHDALANSDPVKAQTVFLDTLIERTRRYTASADVAANTSYSWLDTLGQDMAAAQFGTTPQSRDDVEKQRAAASAQNMEGLQGAITKSSSQGSNKDFGADLELVNQHIEAIRAEWQKSRAQQDSEIVTYLEGVKTKLGSSFKDQESLARVYEENVAELRRSGSSEALKEIDRNAEEAAAKAGGGMEKERQVRLAYLRSMAKDARLSGDDRIAIEDQIASMNMRVVAAGAKDAKRAAAEAYEIFTQGEEEKLQAAKDHYLQQIQIVNDWIAHAKSAYGADSKEYIEAVR